MRVGLAYNLKSDFEVDVDQPVDELEEYDCEETISSLETALANGSHQVLRLGGGRKFLQNIVKHQLDIVFNIAEGWGGRSREAQVPAVLEMLGIPYSGSDPATLAISQDKARLKVLLGCAKIPTPAYHLVKDLSHIKEVNLPFPAIVKPVYEGSSKGIHNKSVVYDSKELFTQVKWLLETYRQPVLVEEFIRGEELTVGIVGNNPPKVIGIMQICPRKREQDFVYSLEVKRDWRNQVDYICPANLSPELLKRVEEVALASYRLLDCRDLSRVDIRLSADGIPYFIEINPLPGLNPHYSDLCIMTGKMGMKYSELITSIFNSALERYLWKG